MSSDRFVYWNDRKPTREQLQLVLEDYVRDLAESVEWDEEGSRFFVKLPGMGCHPATRIADDAVMERMYLMDQKTERWFEVFVCDDNVDIITRHGDRITHAIATEFARICAQFWQGRLEMG